MTLDELKAHALDTLRAQKATHNRLRAKMGLETAGSPERAMRLASASDATRKSVHKLLFLADRRGGHGRDSTLVNVNGKTFKFRWDKLTRRWKEIAQ